VLQPSKILDSQSLGSFIHVDAFKVMEGAYLVAALGDQRESYVFMAKMVSKKNSVKKSKVKKPDSVLTLSPNNHQFVA
jgi:hypothetical protein